MFGKKGRILVLSVGKSVWGVSGGELQAFIFYSFIFFFLPHLLSVYFHNLFSLLAFLLLCFGSWETAIDTKLDAFFFSIAFPVFTILSLLYYFDTSLYGQHHH
ncbi:hypothetical protein QBC38DRAFT_184714 [Podospora fimiseda]|uniref:Uncharacterized protein n=1 Tax=Podospora fimiseda TaxID=252190 RepID=A0AAN7BQL3_9PEZI|nr:hypothetical protein QBC38DRAFT_184714 [Podospora fimiseda]